MTCKQDIKVAVVDTVIKEDSANICVSKLSEIGFYVEEIMPPIDYHVQEISKASIQALLSTISLPAPEYINTLSTQGQYHQVWFLNYPATTLQKILTSVSPPSIHPHVTTKLLLRISGTHFPHRKTENESAILAYVAANAPGVPVPTIVRYDSSRNNAIGYEYQIMTVCPGVEVDSIFRGWDDATKVGFLDQIIRLLGELHSVPVAHIGGFAFAANSHNVVPGSTCEEFALQMPHVDQYWNAYGLNQTPQSLNAQGPFETWTQLNTEWLKKYIFAIKTHPLMNEFSEMIPKLKKLVSILENGGPQEWKLNNMRIVLAHRDLHFGNIMYDTERKVISGIIDWEFSGTAPFCKWDPPKAFLASLPYDEEGLARKRAWVEDFKIRCQETGTDWRTLIFDSENGWSTKEQRLVYEAVDYMRCIFEVAPTGERLNRVRDWRDIVLQRLEELNIS